ncbi:hypothetical protein QZH41_013506, partial [Actinostola sp. cb2023]
STMDLHMVFLALFLFHSVRSELQWVELKTRNSTPPTARRDAAIGYDAIRKQVIIFGGRSGSILDDTWLFNTTSKTWSEVANPKDKDGNVVPENRFSMVYGSQNNYFYVSTGEGKSGSARVFHDDVNRFDFNTQKWVKLEPTTSLRPEKRYGSGGGVHPSGNGLYVTHGFSGVRYSNTLKFTFQTQKWEMKFAGTNSYNPSYPHSRCLHSSAMTEEDELVMYGGCLGGGSTGGPCPSEDGWKYDGDTNTWTKLPQCATPRIYSAMATLPSNDPKVRRAVLYGGKEKTDSVLSTSEAPKNEIIVLDPATNKWIRKKISGDDVPMKRFGHVMVTTPDGIILFGGKGSNGKDLNDVWLLKGNVSDVDKTPSFDGCDGGNFTLIMLHGIFMFIGWGVLLQLGAFIARYFRHKDPWWFKMHRGLQVSGLLFAIAGFVCAVMSVPFDHFKFAHGAIGLDVMIVGLLQPLNGFFRPHRFPDGSRSTKRIIWEWYHKLAGRFALVLALINICLGLFLDVVPTVAWAVWYGYLGVLCLLYVIFEVRSRCKHGSKTGSADFVLDKQAE